jgi:hypothetical protein
MKIRKSTVASALLVSSILAATATADFPIQVTSPGGGYAVRTGDFNHDGLDDLLVFVGDGKGKLAVRLSDGVGSFHETSLLTGATGRFTSTLGSPWLRDENGDGNLDVVADSFKIHRTYRSSNGSYGDFTLYRNVWSGHGDGTFDALVVTERFEGVNTYLPTQIVGDDGIGSDFDQDGDIDVALFRGDANGGYVGPIIVYLWTSQSTPSDDRIVEVADTAFNTMGTGDFNGDGWPDLVLVGQNFLIALLNDANW